MCHRGRFQLTQKLEECMKKVLLIVGIIVVVAGVIALLIGAVNRFMFYHTMDGSGSLYDTLKLRMKISFIIGAVLEIIGAVCLVIRTRL